MVDQSNKKNIFVAAAWPYVNGEIHIGHLVGYMLPSDIFARFSRLSGHETILVSGTDCHGTPITLEADKQQKTPREIVEIYDPKFRELIKTYKISYDNFTTTTTENHKEVTQQMFLQLLENGYIFKKTTKQYFSLADNKFLPDRYVEGECPYCHAQNQRADQCENCGRSLGMGELINPYSKLTKNPVTQKDTEHYFLDFPKLQFEIEKSIDNQKGTRDWVLKEARGWIKEGLEPRAITRDIDWGVEIPVDKIKPEMLLDNHSSKRFYVWFEAVIGYLSASIEWSNIGSQLEASGDYKEKIRIIDNDSKNFSRLSWLDFWKNENTDHYYFMGQDNLAFHMIFWPGQLIGSKSGYNLPTNVSIVKFLNLEGKKFSKSRGVIITAKEAAEKWGADNVRFYLSLILPENKETNWIYTDFVNRVNGELSGNIGNFIHRTLVFYKNKLSENISPENRVLFREVLKESENIFKNVSFDLTNTSFVSALNRILKYSSFGNRLFDHKKPWEVLKHDQNEAEKIIYNCIQIVINLRKLLYPFIPDSMDRLSINLGISKFSPFEVSDVFKFEEVNIEDINLTGDLKPLFTKIEE